MPKLSRSDHRTRHDAGLGRRHPPNPSTEDVMDTKTPIPKTGAETTGKTPGPDLARLNESKAATGRPKDSPARGQPDANVNTPRGGRTVER
jgi:hypothetical protein